MAWGAGGVRVIRRSRSQSDASAFLPCPHFFNEEDVCTTQEVLAHQSIRQYGGFLKMGLVEDIT